MIKNCIYCATFIVDMKYANFVPQGTKHISSNVTLLNLPPPLMNRVVGGGAVPLAEKNLGRGNLWGFSHFRGVILDFPHFFNEFLEF
jgi:hypothetical protein